MAAARTLRRVTPLSPYAVDQVARSVVLDLSKATAQGYRPRRDLYDFLATMEG
jgi:hypothetical protein